jgi:hypothetical protein
MKKHLSYETTKSLHYKSSSHPMGILRASTAGRLQDSIRVGTAQRYQAKRSQLRQGNQGINAS